MEMRKVVEKQDKEVARSEKKVKKLVSEQFHKWIKVFEKKASQKMPIRKM